MQQVPGGAAPAVLAPTAAHVPTAVEVKPVPVSVVAAKPPPKVSPELIVKAGKKAGREASQWTR